VLLGYRVRMATPDTVMTGSLNGIWINKLVILEAPPEIWPKWFRDGNLSRLMPSILTTDFSKVEYWFVHRGDPIRQIGATQYIGQRY
jgi:hypothetical protein